MFFVSAVESETKFEITKEKCVELIKKYRLLSLGQKKCVIETLKSKLQPNNFKDCNKIKKRDFHNWFNKAEQIFCVINETVYFAVSEKKELFLREKINTKGEIIKNRLHRSLPVKKKYFEKHEVKKQQGFELHHIFPLSWSESQEQFKLIDNWKNLLYVDGFSHSKISQNKNKNVKMSVSKEDIILTDIKIEEDKIHLTNKKNVSYKIKLQKCLLNYNKKLNKI